MTATARALSIYNHLRHTADRIADRGWRRCFGWLGVLVAYYSYIYAPSNGIAVDAGAVNVFLSLVFGAFVTRSAERVLTNHGVPGGGLVNPAAIS